MLCYLDTSALVKKYFHEKGTEVLQGLLGCDPLTVFTSDVTKVEMFHAIYRKKEEALLKDNVVRKIVAQFRGDMAAFKIVFFNPAVIKKAQFLIKKEVLKTLDAIHVASALILKIQAQAKVNFVSSDERQNQIAKSYGLIVINPAIPPFNPLS